MERIIDRVDLFLADRKLRDHIVCQKAGISNGTFTNARKPGHDLSKRTVEKLLDEFPELNPNWLIRGEGNMYEDRVTAIDVLTKQQMALHTIMEEIDTMIKALRNDTRRH